MHLLGGADMFHTNFLQDDLKLLLEYNELDEGVDEKEFMECEEEMHIRAYRMGVGYGEGEGQRRVSDFFRSKTRWHGHATWHWQTVSLTQKFKNNFFRIYGTARLYRVAQSRGRSGSPPILPKLAAWSRRVVQPGGADP